MTLNEALVAWRRTRHPRWAAVVEALGKEDSQRELVGAGKKKAEAQAWHALAKKADVHDLPRLFAAALTTSAADATERLRLLAKLDDPRLTTLFLAALEAPPWRANVFKDFVKEGLAAIHRSRDVRAREPMQELASRYKAIVETAVGDVVSTLLTRAADAMDKLEPGELTAADEKKLAAFEATAPAPAKKRVKSQSDAALLSLIYASPDDDQPRLVFADALTERGDVRGEFISLQLARAAGRATPAQRAREEELASDPKRYAAWSLPLANGGDCTLNRGFPERIKLKPAVAKKILGDPSWATIRAVEGLETLSAKLAAQFLDHPTLARVKEVGRINENLAAALKVTRRRWTRLAGHFVPTRAQTETWAALETLSLHHSEPDGKITAEVLAPLENLNALEVSEPLLAPGALSAVPQLTHFRLTLEGKPAPADLLAPLTRLESLELGAASELPLGDVLSRVSKTVRTLSLRANYLEQAQVEAALAAMPNVENLQLHAPEWASVQLITNLIEGTKVRTVKIDHDGGDWELDGAHLTLHWLGFQRTPEKVLGARLPSSVKSARFKSALDDSARALVDAYFTAHGVQAR